MRLDIADAALVVAVLASAPLLALWAGLTVRVFAAAAGLE